MHINRVHAREVLDSRGNPTVEAEVHCQGGAWGRAMVPSGASIGTHEALELRDGDLARHDGKGVLQAVANVNEIIAPRLAGRAVTEQAAIDRLLCELDGTPNKSRLGGNAILGVSLACAHAAAAAQGVPLFRYLDPEGKATLPLPMINMISGGLHAGGNLDFQDFLLLPIGAKSYSEALHMALGVYRALGRVLTRRGYEAHLVGDEGGYGPRLQSNQEALQLLVEAFEQAGYAPGSQAAIAIDVASTHFFRNGAYHLRVPGAAPSPQGDRPAVLASEQVIELLAGWVERFPILSIEDGLAEDDWAGWRKLTEVLGDTVQLIGDDLLATNPARLRRAIDEKVANCVLVKMNQIGTLTETLEVIRLARTNGYTTVVSARSGETEDATLADLAVATAAGQVKIGCITRGERLAKYNQLLRIEEALGPYARFDGGLFRR